MEKKKYIEPSLEIINMKKTNIIVLSGENRLFGSTDSDDNCEYPW